VCSSDLEWEVGLESVAHAAIKYYPENFRIKFLKNTNTTRPDLITKCLSNVELNKFIKDSDFFENFLQSNKKLDPGSIKYCVRDRHNKIMKSTMNENDEMIKIFHNQEFGKENTEASFSAFFVEMKRSEYPVDFDMKIFVKFNTWYNFYDICRIIFENVLDKKNLIKHFRSVQPAQDQSDNKQYFTIEVANADKLKPYFMCVYTDIIKPHRVGNVNTKMLAMRKIQNHNKHQEWHVNEIRYYPVESRKMSNIKILITDHHGEEIDFEDSDFVTVINLRFRKKSI